MAGGPSHLETFDYKPKLAEMHGSRCPSRSPRASRSRSCRAEAGLLRPAVRFQKFGKSGQEICELFPHIGGVADDLCIVRSMWTEQINHDPAHTFMNTGSHHRRPAEHGLVAALRTGREAEDLPGFVVLSSGRGGQNAADRGAAVVRGLPAQPFQGVQVASKGDPVLYLGNPPASDARHSSGRHRRGQRAEPVRARRGRGRPGDRHAHRAVRDGVQDAGQRAGLMD
jgi:hypothetical protein